MSSTPMRIIQGREDKAETNFSFHCKLQHEYRKLITQPDRESF